MRGRPYRQRVPGQPTQAMNIRVTAVERGMIARAARHTGKSPSVYMRDVLIAAALTSATPRPRRLPRWLPE